MTVSNNIMTRAFAIRWGLPAVQAMASGLGMSSTHLRQAYIGCAFRGGVRNELTVSDAAKLYRAVNNGSALSGTAKKQFWKILAGGAPSSTSVYGTVVAQEAAALGKSADVTQFLANMEVKGKAGSYAFCLGGGCNPYKTDLAYTGRMLIPFRTGAGKIKQHAYLFGDFVNDLVVPCALGSGCAAEANAGALLSGVVAEEARTEIHAALLTWP